MAAAPEKPEGGGELRLDYWPSGCIGFNLGMAHARVVESENGLVIEMQIQEIDLTSKEGLQVLTAGTGTNGEFGIILRVPTGDLDRWPWVIKTTSSPC